MTDAPWAATVLTLFPEMFPGPLGHSLAGKALDGGLWALEAVDIRDFARDKHASVDDAPFGGGPGMVMRPDVVDAAVASAATTDLGGPPIYLTPRGRPLTQARVAEFAQAPGAVILCGRFEGVDELGEQQGPLLRGEAVGVGEIHGPAVGESHASPYPMRAASGPSCRKQRGVRARLPPRGLLDVDRPCRARQEQSWRTRALQLREIGGEESSVPCEESVRYRRGVSTDQKVCHYPLPWAAGGTIPLPA